MVMFYKMMKNSKNVENVELKNENFIDIYSSYNPKNIIMSLRYKC